MTLSPPPAATGGESWPRHLWPLFLSQSCTSPAWTDHAKLWLHPCLFTRLEQGSQQLGSLSSRVQHAPALAGRSEGAVSGLAKQKGRRKQGGKEAGGSRASPFREAALRAGRLLPFHLLSSSPQPSLQLEVISHRDQASQGLLQGLGEPRSRGREPEVFCALVSAAGSGQDN